MSKYRKLLVRRMLREDVKKFGITTVPSLFLINQDATFKKLAQYVFFSIKALLQFKLVKVWGIRVRGLLPPASEG